MTYFGFHLWFILPPIVVLHLLWMTSRLEGHRRAGYRALGLIVAAAFLYTILWDNYLVYRGVWSYAPNRVIATIAYVPIEEYAFFILQPLLSGLLYLVLSKRKTTRTSKPSFLAKGSRFGITLMVCISVLGIFCLAFGGDRALYLGLILSWCGPVLAVLMWIGFDKIWTARRAATASLTISTIYLCIADFVAIRMGIWTISEQYSLGINLFGLPIEEAVFFLVTNWMVIQGVAMLMPNIASSIPA